jgi:sugar lactone lactonase YvrE
MMACRASRWSTGRESTSSDATLRRSPEPTPVAARRALRAAVALFVVAMSDLATAAEELGYPLSVAVNRSGAVYVADRKLPGVWRLDAEPWSVFHRANQKFRTPLNAIRCVAFDGDGRLLAGDSATRDIYRFDDKGAPQPLTAQGKPFGGIGIPMAIVVDAEGNLLVSDLETHRILKVPKGGGAAQPFATLQAPRGLFHDSKKQLWAISGRKLVRLSPKGEPTTIVADGVFAFPHCVVVADDGTAYVSDGYAKAIWRIPPGGKPEKWVSGGPLVNPVGLALHQGRLLVADSHAKAVFEIDAKGSLTRRAGEPASRTEHAP